MCMVSNIGDDWAGKFPKNWPQFNPPPITVPVGVPQSEFDALKAEVKELKKLLKAAKKFDAATGQPDCQMEEKIKLIRAIAKLVGVNLDEVLPKTA